jgi:NAD(P)-dependent dehydrogenase (short-subunit alcohol dehydrogenase family)
MGRLSGRTAVVTGAAEGIGAHYARALAGEGANVCLVDVLASSGLADEINALNAGGRAISKICDVSNAAAISAVIAEAERAFGGVQVLVNNAAVFARLTQKPMEQISSEEFDEALRVNVRGVFECVKAVIPVMRRQKYGKIINIASGTVFRGATGMLHYVASKGAVLSMTRSMARELGGDGIRCNCIAPGLVMTEAIKARTGPAVDLVKQYSVDARSLKREQQPEDLVGSLIYLASADSDFVTGQVLVVDGGNVMH